jgi:hypothetical protein
MGTESDLFVEMISVREDKALPKFLPSQQEVPCICQLLHLERAHGYLDGG